MVLLWWRATVYGGTSSSSILICGCLLLVPVEPRTTPDEAALVCRAGILAMKSNSNDVAKTHFTAALSMNPFLWEAVEGLCRLGASRRRKSPQKSVRTNSCSYRPPGKREVSGNRSHPPFAVGNPANGPSPLLEPCKPRPFQ